MLSCFVSDAEWLWVRTDLFSMMEMDVVANGSGGSTWTLWWGKHPRQASERKWKKGEFRSWDVGLNKPWLSKHLIHADPSCILIPLWPWIYTCTTVFIYSDEMLQPSSFYRPNSNVIFTYLKTLTTFVFLYVEPETGSSMAALEGFAWAPSGKIFQWHHGIFPRRRGVHLGWNTTMWYCETIDSDRFAQS